MQNQRREKPSDYGTQLSAKQKLKCPPANIGERQFRRYYTEAVRRKGDTGENLIELLERRLDCVVYRMKLVPTPFAARQLINHGHVLVNGKRLNIGSAKLSDGDTVELRPKAKDMALVLEATQSSERDVPDYIEIDYERMRGRFIRAPKIADVPYPVTMEPNLVIEFYSQRKEHTARQEPLIGRTCSGRPSSCTTKNSWMAGPLPERPARAGRPGTARAYIFVSRAKTPFEQGVAMLLLHLSIIFFLILLNGFFAMAEIALVSARPARLQPLAGRGQRRGASGDRAEGRSVPAARRPCGSSVTDHRRAT